MKRHHNQAGFTLIEAVLLIAVLAIVGVIGLRVYNNNQTAPETAATEKTSAKAPEDKPAPQIKTTADLTKAENTLDAVNPDADDGAQLDTQLAAF